MKLFIGDYNLSSWSLRPWLALKHAGLPFEVEVIRLDQPETAAAIAQVSPSGRVPVLHQLSKPELGPAGGYTILWDSLAICEYAAELAARTEGASWLWPENPATRALARSVACEMHSGFAHLRSQHPMRLAERLPRSPSPEVQLELQRIRSLWRELRTRHAQQGPWLFGSFSIADAMFAPVASRFRTYDLPTDDVAVEYIATIFAHPAVKEWERHAQEEVAARAAVLP